LLSKEYVSAKTKLHVRCADSHEFDITADNLSHRRWCPECKRQNQRKRLAINFRTVEEMRKFAFDRHGGSCLATASSPMLSRVTWKCNNREHPSFEAVLAKVIHSGQWCPACWQERRKPPKPAILFDTLVDVVRKRGGEVVKLGGDGIWTGSKTRVLLRCANGHEWSADASNLLYAGSWCPECLNKGERIVRAIFETTFGGKFPKSKPEWLVSNRGRKLELDGYNHQRQIAFEYQGPHHRSSDYVMAHDEIKRAACAARSIQLIEVDATKTPYPVENVLEKVAEALRRWGIKETAILPPGNIFAAELRQLSELARKMGGQLVSTKYLGSEKHEWKCGIAEHSSWLAEPWRIRRGAWCPSCARNRRLGVEGLRSWGYMIGLNLLETEYKGGTLAVYRWQCQKSGHVILRSRTNILQSLSRGLLACPVCAGTRHNQIKDDV